MKKKEYIQPQILAVVLMGANRLLNIVSDSEGSVSVTLGGAQSTRDLGDVPPPSMDVKSHTLWDDEW